VPALRLFRASDSYHLHYRHWTPAESGPPRGYVVALHGIQSHSGWYTYSSERMAAAGYDVRFLDRRGSGLNGCRRGDAPHYARLIQDVRQFLDNVRSERDRDAPGAPVILLAVSWGGKTAAAVAAQFPDRLDGLALLYPGLCAKVRPNPLERFLIRLGRSAGKGQKRIVVPLNDPALFTGETEWQEFIREDRLALREVSLDFLQASLDFERVLARDIDKITAPLLLMLAGRDEIIDNRRTTELVMRAASDEKTLYRYSQARHTLEFEPDREAIFSDLIGWLNRLSSSRLTG